MRISLTRDGGICERVWLLKSVEKPGLSQLI